MTSRTVLCLSLCLSALTLASGCSMIRDFKEMKKATGEMKYTTRKMNEALGSTDGKIQDMKDSMDNVSADLRQGDSFAVRRDNLQLVKGAETIELKAQLAGVYLMAFEYQLFPVQGPVPEAFRERLQELAVQEFFLAMKEFVRSDRPWHQDVKRWLITDEDVNSATTDNAQMCLFAFAVALDRLNVKQEMRAKNTGEKPVSMLSLIQNALLTRDTAIPAYRQVLNFEALAVYLLQLRYNGLAAAALDNVTGLADMNILRQLWRVKYGWELDFKSLNDAQISFFNEWGLMALDARNFLGRIGVAPRMNLSLLRIFGNMQVTNTRVSDPRLAARRTDFLMYAADLTFGGARGWRPRF